MMNVTHNRRRNSGFTLVELLVVIVIIGILAAILLPQLKNIRHSTGDKTALVDAKTALTMYKTEKADSMAASIVMFVKGKEAYYVFGYNRTEARLKISPKKLEEYNSYASMEEAVSAIVNSALNGTVFRLETTSTIPPEYINLSATMKKNRDNVVIYAGELINGAIAEPDATPDSTPIGNFTTTFTYEVDMGGGNTQVKKVELSTDQDASKHTVPKDPKSIGNTYFAYWKLVSVNNTNRDEPAYELYDGAKFTLPTANVVYEAVFLPEKPKLNTVTSEYEIYNKVQFVWFANSLNNSSISKSSNARLMRNIMLNKNVLTRDLKLNTADTFTEWTPMCDTQEVAYSGTFDGNGHVISGLYINSPTKICEGLFGYVDGAKFKDLGIVDSYICAKGRVGAIAGATPDISIGTVTFLRCYNGGVVTSAVKKDSADPTTPVNAYAGGLIGFVTAKLNVNGCYNTGVVSGSGDGRYCGGVVGYISVNAPSASLSNSYNSGKVTTCDDELAYFGGVVGATGTSTTFENCYNNGEVSCKGAGVGGIVGYLTEAAESLVSIQINKCYTTIDSVINGGQMVGGVVGTAKCTRVAFADCYNSGTVSSKRAADLIQGTGGMLGCSQIGATVSINNCVNNGEVESVGMNVGGMVGLTQDACTINSCSNNGGNIYGIAQLGGIVGSCIGGEQTISDCTNSGEIKATKQPDDIVCVYVGGIVGYCATTATIGRSSNTGAVSGYQYVGGIVGYNDLAQVTITRCINNGAVMAINSCIGGIIGGIKYLASINRCANLGDLTAGAREVGGIAGHIFTTAQGSLIKNSYNAGLMQASKYCGGIIGYGAPTLTIENCYNVGYAYTSATTAENKVCGGIVGVNSNAGLDAPIVTNCYYLNGCTNATVKTPGGIAKAIDSFSDNTVTDLLNANTVVGETAVFTSTHFLKLTVVTALNPSATTPTTTVVMQKLPIVLALHPGAESPTVTP